MLEKNVRVLNSNSPQVIIENQFQLDVVLPFVISILIMRALFCHQVLITQIRVRIKTNKNQRVFFKSHRFSPLCWCEVSNNRMAMCCHHTH